MGGEGVGLCWVQAAMREVSGDGRSHVMRYHPPNQHMDMVDLTTGLFAHAALWNRNLGVLWDWNSHSRFPWT
jgi:hypothetical protein